MTVETSFFGSTNNSTASSTGNDNDDDDNRDNNDNSNNNDNIENDRDNDKENDEDNKNNNKYQIDESASIITPSPSSTTTSTTTSPPTKTTTTTAIDDTIEKEQKIEKSVGTTTTKKIDEIIKEIGYIEKEYNCTHNNFTGTLYAGPIALVFLGRIFFFEWTIVIKWDDICNIKKMEHGDGVRVVVRRSSPSSSSSSSFSLTSKINNKDKSYYCDFEQFVQYRQDDVWTSLVSIHNQTIRDGSSSSNTNENNNNNSNNIGSRKRTSSQSSAFPLRRMNSDPLRTTPKGLLNIQDSFNDDDSNNHEDYDDDYMHRYTLSPSPSNENMTISNKSKNIRSSKLQRQWSEIVEDRSTYSECIVESLELPCDLQTFISMFVQDEAKYSIPMFMKANGDAEINVSKWTTEATATTTTTTNNNNNNNSNNNSSSSNQGIDAASSVNDDNNNDNSIDSGGDDDDVDSSNKKDDCDSKSRIVEYTHPVNAPMAPPMARARKEQTFRQYGGHGLVLETKTYVEDVPMTDCFYVADIIRVEPKNVTSVKSNDENSNNDNNKNNNENERGKDNDNTNSSTNKNHQSVIVSMHYDIRFVKSTMFQAIISRTTKREFEKFSTNLAEFMSKSLEGEEKGRLIVDTTAVARPPEVAVLPPPPPTTTTPKGVTDIKSSPRMAVDIASAAISSLSPINVAIFAVLAIVLIMQLRIMSELQSVRVDLQTIIVQQHYHHNLQVDNDFVVTTTQKESSLHHEVAATNTQKVTTQQYQHLQQKWTDQLEDPQINLDDLIKQKIDLALGNA